jgi:hypothetical protein
MLVSTTDIAVAQLAVGLRRNARSGFALPRVCTAVRAAIGNVVAVQIVHHVVHLRVRCGASLVLGLDDSAEIVDQASDFSNAIK